MTPQQPKLRLKDRRRRLLWTKAVLAAGGAALILVVLFFALHAPQITVSEVAVSGARTVDAHAVEALARGKLAGSYGFIVPHANALFIPAGAIQSAVSAAFPQIASVRIERSGLTGITLALTEREAAAVWCSGEAPADSGAKTQGDCYSMDAGGFVYATSTDDGTLVRYYGDVSGNPIGQKFLSGDFSSLLSVVNGIGSSVSLTPLFVAVDPNTLDVSLTFAEGGVLRFERAGDPQSTVANIASVFASQSLKSHPAFEYIDFRFGDKVYVKFK